MKAFISLPKQRGIALIQVIITTSIIMMLMIYFLSAAKSQVKRARALQDKSSAYLSHYSAKNQVLYQLLTSEYHGLRQQGWNFHGVPIQINEHTTIAIQDLNGLLSLASMTQHHLLERVLGQVRPSGEAMEIAASLQDWIDPNNMSLPNGAEQAYYSGQNIEVRNGPIQTYTEFPYIKGMTIEGEEALLASTTIHPTPFFNPMSAPEHVLGAFMSDNDKAAQVISLRGSSGFNKAEVENITGIYSEDGINYLLGPGFRLDIQTNVADSYFGKVLEFGIYPYREWPVQVLSRLPRQQLSR